MTKLSDEVLERMARATKLHLSPLAAMQAAWDASPAGELVEALIEARSQLEEYEERRSGERYNSVQINTALAKAGASHV